MTCSLALRTLPAARRRGSPRRPRGSCGGLLAVDGSLDPGHRANSCIVGVRCGPACQRPSRRSTCFLSPPMTSAARPRRRVRLLGFFSSRCARYALRRRILPVPGDLEALGGAAVGLHLRHHAAPSLGWRVVGVGSALVPAAFGPSGFARAWLRPSLLGRGAAPWSCCGRPGGACDSTIANSATSSATRLRIFRPSSGWAISRPRNMIVSLTLLPSPRKRIDVLHLGDVVVLVDLGPELHLLDDDVRGLALRLLAPLFLLVDVPAVVHDPADRRVGVGRDLDEIELLLAGMCERFGRGLTPSCSPSAPMRRTSRARMRSLIRASCAAIWSPASSGHGFLNLGWNLDPDAKMADTGSVRHQRRAAHATSAGCDRICGPGAPRTVCVGGRVGTTGCHAPRSHFPDWLS